MLRKKSKKAQEFAISLATAPTVLAAADAVGVSHRQAWRYMRDPEIARQAQILSNIVNEGIMVLYEIFKDEKVPPADRIKAIDLAYRMHCRAIRVAERRVQLRLAQRVARKKGRVIEPLPPEGYRESVPVPAPEM